MDAFLPICFWGLFLSGSCERTTPDTTCTIVFDTLFVEHYGMNGLGCNSAPYLVATMDCSFRQSKTALSDAYVKIFSNDTLVPIHTFDVKYRKRAWPLNRSLGSSTKPRTAIEYVEPWKYRMSLPIRVSVRAHSIRSVTGYCLPPGSYRVQVHMRHEDGAEATPPFATGPLYVVERK